MNNSLPTAGLRPRRIADAAAFGKVAVLYGGRSAEREVSLKSGAAVLAGLRANGVDASGLDKDQRIIHWLLDGSFDRVFIILHGRGGEDGTLQGALDTLGLPYTGSGVLGSALAIDKLRSKQIWRQCGVPTPDFHSISDRTSLQQASGALGYPLAVKPVHEGSSLGVSKAYDDQSLLRAWDEAKGFGDDVFVEPWLDGPEYTAGILDPEILPLIRLETPRVFYDYAAKYNAGEKTEYHCPCGLDQKTEQAWQQLSLDAFTSLGGLGWGRVDFICDADGNPQVLDVNTAPGMTSHSLVPAAARAVGIEFPELVWRILETSIR